MSSPDAGRHRSDEHADLDAIRQMQAGDGAGLERLYDRHSTAIYSLALRILGQPADAEDVVQDVFSQAWRSAASYDRSRGVVVAWLLIICRSRSLDAVRRRRRAPAPAADDSVFAQIPDHSPSVELIAATAQQVALAQRALETLPAEQRVVFNLAYYEGLTQVEIAARTSSPLGTVKTRIRSALRHVRDAVFEAGAPRGEES